MPDHARDLLEPGKTAVVIFTRGDKFKNKAGTGYSGNWRIRRNDLDMVIIYYRSEKSMFGAELFIGKFEHLDVAFEPANQEERNKRRSVHFTNLKSGGETQVNFRTFTENFRTDFCFITR